ncbi:MAG: methyltransferase domain-containing protein [Deltaproteobacteria bacterium]|nr:MAG: methyltransferase domain-containing protein [Deltaproteobacteria bacterium]
MIAWVMERETAAQNDAALAALAINPRDRILEIGFGHGRTLEQLVAATPSGSVAGLDHSSEMYEMARRRCAPLLQSGRLALRLGNSKALPYPDAHFDKVLAVHTIYFWDNPTEHLRELHRVMKSRAVCVLGFRPKEDPHAASFPETVYRFYSREVVRDLLFDVGFANIDISEPVPGLVLARAVKQS